MNSPSATDVLADVDLSSVGDLSPNQRQTILVIMARVAERSYRRGAQQAIVLSQRKTDLPGDIGEWRYAASTDASPWLTPARVTSSIDRLLTENAGLRPLLGSEVTMPTSVGVEQAARRLLAWAKRRHEAQARDDSLAAIDAKQQIEAIGIELSLTPSGMADAYDAAVEIGGEDAIRGVSAIWTGIGGWSA